MKMVAAKQAKLCTVDERLVVDVIQHGDFTVATTTKKQASIVKIAYGDAATRALIVLICLCFLLFKLEDKIHHGL